MSRFENLRRNSPRYYIDKDTSIKQEGLTVSCHSILIVGLQFRFLRRIPQLIFDEEDPVDDHLYFDMKPKRKTYLFKFFVPQVDEVMKGHF